MLASIRGTALRQSPHQDWPEEGSGEAKKTRKCRDLRPALGGMAARAEAREEDGMMRGISGCTLRGQEMFGGRRAGEVESPERPRPASSLPSTTTTSGMKFNAAYLLGLLAATTAAAAPALGDQLTFSPTLDLEAASDTLQHAVDTAGTILDGVTRKAHTWAAEGVRKFDEIVKDEITCASSFEPPRGGEEGADEAFADELIKHEDFPSYSIRLKEPKLCDSSVKSYSGEQPSASSFRHLQAHPLWRTGYLDIDEETHLFFVRSTFLLRWKRAERSFRCSGSSRAVPPHRGTLSSCGKLIPARRKKPELTSNPQAQRCT